MADNAQTKSVAEPGDGKNGTTDAWVCPNCGRTFKRHSQSHYCGEKPASIDAYIAAQPEHLQPFLREVRETIRRAIPDAQERISWSMPTFWNGHNIIHFAGFQNHVGLYPGPEAVAKFSERIKDCKSGKGRIQFTYSKPLPLLLIGEIAKWCYETGNHP